MIKVLTVGVYDYFHLGICGFLKMLKNWEIIL